MFLALDAVRARGAGLGAPVWALDAVRSLGAWLGAPLWAARRGRSLGALWRVEHAVGLLLGLRWVRGTLWRAFVGALPSLGPLFAAFGARK